MTKIEIAKVAIKGAVAVGTVVALIVSFNALNVIKTVKKDVRVQRVAIEELQKDVAVIKSNITVKKTVANPGIKKFDIRKFIPFLGKK